MLLLQLEDDEQLLPESSELQQQQQEQHQQRRESAAALAAAVDSSSSSSSINAGAAILDAANAPAALASLSCRQSGALPGQRTALSKPRTEFKASSET